MNQGLIGSTLWGVHSVVMFSFSFFWKFWLPNGLHNSCSISQTAGGTCQKCFTKYHDCVDAPQCKAEFWTGSISEVGHCNCAHLSLSVAGQLSELHC